MGVMTREAGGKRGLERKMRQGRVKSSEEKRESSSLKNEINPTRTKRRNRKMSATDQLLPPLNEGRTEWEPSVSRGGDKRRNDVGGGRCGY